MRTLMLWGSVVLLSACAQAQLQLSDSSRINDPVYLRGQIKNIADADLFGALTLEAPGLEQVRDAWRAGDTSGAYAAWGRYRNGAHQPQYVTEMERLMLDTDLLTGYADHRASLDARPAERETIMARAGAILRNRIRVWGDRVESFGDTVDFNRDVGRSGKYGFHYWLWARPLLSAAVLTGDDRYVTKFRELFTRWYEQRNGIDRSIPDFDPVYYELGLGVRTKPFVDYYLMPEKDRPWSTHRDMLKTFLGAGRWLYQLEEWEGYRPGNWQIVGSFALVQLALTVPEFKESPAWLALGLLRLTQHLDRDFFADGGHSERSPRNYTSLTYLTYRNLAYLLDAYHTQPEIAARIRAAIGRTIDWWVAMMTPLGETPALNDSHRGLFAARIMEDADRMLGIKEGAAVVHRLQDGTAGGAGALPPYTSRHLPASGFSIMRSSWDRDALYLSITYGPFAGFHSHADLLAFELYAYGKAMAVDAGLGMTYDDTLYVPWYKSTRAHNTVALNDSDMAREGYAGENVVWESGPDLDYFSADHRGYAERGAVHRRQILFVKPSYWVVFDEVTCTHAHDTLSWYLHAPVRMQQEGDRFVSTEFPGLLVAPATPMATKTGWGRAATTGDPVPGRTMEVNWLRFDQVTEAGAVRRFPVLLFPFHERPLALRFNGEGPSQFVVAVGDTTDFLSFGPQKSGRIRTDAACAWVRTVGGNVVRFSTAGAGFMVFEGKRTQEGTLSRLFVWRRGGERVPACCWKRAYGSTRGTLPPVRSRPADAESRRRDV